MPEEMRRAIARRRLVRTEMEFQAAIDRMEAANPIGPIAESFRTVA
jgi:hypothetical protein